MKNFYKTNTHRKFKKTIEQISLFALILVLTLPAAFLIPEPKKAEAAAATVRAVGAIDAGAAAISPGLPAGTVAGDLLIMFVENSGEATTTATGWTILDAQNTTGTRLNVLYKIAVGSDTTTTNDVGDHQMGRIIGITTGTFDASDPFGAGTLTKGAEAAGTSKTITGMTTTINEALVLAAIGADLPDANGTANWNDVGAGGGWTNASLTSLTERVDNSTNGGNGGSLGVASGQKSTAGATGNTTVTAGSSRTSAHITFAVKPVLPPTVTTQAASSVTATGATLNGNITVTGGASATVRGFAWGTNSSLSGGDTATTTENGTFGTGAFTNSALTLVCNTTYYARAYATNSAGTSYGAISSSFTTSACVPTVTTQAASSVTATGATLNGNITVTGGASATVRGFAWGTNSSLSGGDTATTTENGTFGTGAFTNSALTLVCNTTYYARAYATNSAGTSYGAISSSFTTSACVRYWVGGSGNWDAADTTHWSLTSGGAGGASVPTSNEDVIFDTLSNATAYVVTVSAQANTLNLTIGNPLVGAITLGGSSTINIYGNSSLASGMVFSYVGNLSYRATSGTKTITNNGVIIISDFTLNGSGGTFQLIDGLNIGGNADFIATAGTFDANGQTVTMSGAAQVITPTVAITFYNLNRTPTTPAKTDSLTLTGNITVSNLFTVSDGATLTNRVLVTSDVLGTSRTITAASVSLSNADFQDITGAGAASWTGTSMGDALGNSNVTFDAPTTQTNTGATGNWSDVTKWTSRVPLPQDTVVISSGSGTVTMDMPRMGANISFAGFTGTFTTVGAASTVIDIFGNFAWGSGMTIAGGAGTVGFNLYGRSSHTITSNGKSFTRGVAIGGPGGTYTLQDNFSMSSGILDVDAGTFDANDYNVSTDIVRSQGSATRVITMGNGTWSINRVAAANAWNMSTSGLTVNAEGSTIEITAASTEARTFAGAGKTYNILSYTVANSPGSLTIAGANTFNTLNVSFGRILTMPAGSTNTVTNWNVNGAVNGYVYMPGVVSNYASTPDSVPLSITGDITIDVKVALDDWTPSTIMGLAGKYLSTGNQKGYIFRMEGGTGKLQLIWSPDGSTDIVKTSTVVTGITDGTTKWVRVTLDVDNGAAGNDVKFYLSDDGSVWTQLGSTVTTAGTTSQFDNNVALEIGAYSSGASTVVSKGKFYQARIYSDLTQTTKVFDADLSTKTVGADSFTESSSNGATVTINGDLAKVGDGRVSLVSSIAASAATLSMSSGTAISDYLSVKDSTATGGATWYAGANSINVSGNTGWIFSSPSPTLTTEHYRFRNDDGSEVAATYIGSEDSAITDNLFTGDRVRLRMLLKNTGAGPSTDYQYLLEHASSSCSVWMPVPTSTTSGSHWVMDSSGFVTDGASTTDSASLTNPGGLSFLAGFLKTTNNQTPAFSIPVSQFTEFEYSLRSTSNVSTGTNYCFRLTNAGSATNFVYTVTPQITLPSITFRRSGGGPSRNAGGENDATPGAQQTGGGTGGSTGGNAGGESGGSGQLKSGGGAGGGGGDTGFLWMLRMFALDSVFKISTQVYSVLYR